MQLNLTDEEAALLTTIVDYWVQGYEPATTDVVNDGEAFEEPEDYLKAIDGMHRDFSIATTIQQKLKGEA